MAAVELARDLDGVELGLVGEALADGAGPAGNGAVGAEVHGTEVRGAAGRQSDDGVAQRDGAELHLDRAARQKRQLDVRRLRRVEAADAAPGHGVAVGGGVRENAAAGRRIEVREERGDARRTDEHAGDVAFGAGIVAALEGQVAVRVDERDRLAAAVEAEGERQVELNAVVVGQRQAAADGGAEGAVDPRGVVTAGAVEGETQADGAQVVGVGRFDEVALILDDCDLSDVDRVAVAGGRKRPADAAGARAMKPERVEQAAAGVAVGDAALARQQRRRRRLQGLAQVVAGSICGGFERRGGVACGLGAAATWRRRPRAGGGVAGAIARGEREGCGNRPAERGLT